MGKYTFGPVPSRRLGSSLGVNNIPPKHCSYSCVYCQVGKTIFYESKRKEYYPYKEIADEVIATVKNFRGKIDYITFVPDGEPTLDINLGKTANIIKSNIEKPIAILSNSSLIGLEDVQEDLLAFNLVSLKIDSVYEKTWKLINRPHPSLNLKEILYGIKKFSKRFKGKLIFEVMLVKGINDNSKNYKGIANFLTNINFDKVYISVPTRPPAEKWVKPPSEKEVVKAYDIFKKKVGNKVELLINYEGANFSALGNAVDELISIVSVHPMRIDYVYKFLKKRKLNPEETIRKLERDKKILKVKFRGYEFITRYILRPRVITSD